LSPQSARTLVERPSPAGATSVQRNSSWKPGRTLHAGLRLSVRSLLLLLVVTALAVSGAAADPISLYVGTYTDGTSRGIYRLTFDPETGRLGPPLLAPAGGKTPRHFAIDPTGRYILIACQNSGTIAVMRLDHAAGPPVPVGAPVSLDRPVCLLPVPKP
jgi:6-phosphogluconolactonase